MTFGLTYLFSYVYFPVNPPLLLCPSDLNTVESISSFYISLNSSSKYFIQVKLSS